MGHFRIRRGAIRIMRCGKEKKDEGITGIEEVVGGVSQRVPKVLPL